MRPRALAAVVAILFVACGKKDAETGAPDATAATTATATSTTTATATASSKPTPPWPSDAPDRNAACATHDDCAVLMHDAILAPDPCCAQRVGFLPVTRKYAEWTSQSRVELCKGVVCPPSPLPGAEPSCCASIGRCVKKKCILGCDDPTLDAPKVTWHEPQCRMAVQRPK